MKLSKLSFLAFVVSIPLLYSPLLRVQSASASSPPAKAQLSGQNGWVADTESETFVYYDNGEGATCRPATTDEAAAFAMRDDGLEMKVIHPEGPSLRDAGNINIVLRSTAQLDGFPAAKAGFLAAAAKWQDRLQSLTPITVVLDVDFGPTRFGTPFGANVL